jgi:outer membrane protein OmpA-like peptidoglycan-associated protein
LESGYSRLEGTNPLVLDVTLIPLALKFCYELPIYYGFGAQGGLLAGYFFSKTSRYLTAIDMMTGNLRTDNELNLFAGARLYATWTAKGQFLKIYAGGGADIVLEPDGPIPLPLLEAGISIRPFALFKRPVRQLVNPVYFEINGAAIREQYMPTLDEAGRRLRENPSLRITLRTYAPPPGDAEWQVRRHDETPALSAARAGYCAEYLRENYGVEPGRIRIEYRDAGKASDEARREMFRCVDLIIK